MNRRLFLHLLGLSGISLVTPRFARAATAGQAARYFVMIRMQGGWDVTLGLDAKTHGADDDQGDMFIEYQPSEILKAGSLLVAPAMKPMLRHAGGFSIVNGLITATSDNGHTANLEYMSSGNGSGKAPYMPAEIGASTHAGSLGVVFYGQTNILDRNVMTTSTNNVESLKTALDLGSFGDLVDGQNLKSDFYKAQQSMLGDSVNLARLNALLDASKVSAETDQMKRAALVLAATFASGTAYQGQIDLQTDSLDTHSSHEGTHLKAQTGGWESVAKILDVFKATQLGTTGASLFDQTLFVVISEFSRTPALNAAKGKDHNPLCNSTLFAGGLVKPDVSFGASHVIPRKKAKSGESSHTALPINMTTGQAAANRTEADSGAFQYLTPETLVATVAQIQQVDSAKFRSVPLTTPAIKALIK